MGSPAYEKSWQFALNQPLPDVSTALAYSRSQLWLWHALLVGATGGMTQGLYEVVGSSDGVTAGLDGIDRWDVPAKLVFSTSGGRSWLVLRTGPLYLGVSCCHPNNAGSNFVRWFYSYTAPTGGSPTADPTFTNDWGAGAYLADGEQRLNAGGAALPSKLHMGLCSDGSFYCLLSRNGALLFSWAQLVTVLAGLKAGDAGNSFVAFTGFSDSGPLTDTLGLGDANNTSANGRTRCRVYFAGTGQHSMQQCAAWLPAMANGGLMRQATSPSMWPGTTGDMIDNSHPFWPAWFGRLDVNPPITNTGFIKGRAQDVGLAFWSELDGNVDSVVAPKWMNAGILWLPTNAVPALN